MLHKSTVHNATVEAMQRIAGVQGHQHPRMTLHKSHSQVFLLQGEANIGKKESVLEWIRFLSCANVQRGMPCNVCKSCLQHFFFRNHHVFWCSLENTLDYVGFLLKQYQNLQQNLGDDAFLAEHLKENNPQNAFLATQMRYFRGLRLQIRREIMRILSWHRSGIFPLLKEKKKSFAQGVVLDEQQLAHFLTQAQRWLEREWFFDDDDEEVLLNPNISGNLAENSRISGNNSENRVKNRERRVFSDQDRTEVWEMLSALHHCFDRSMIIKEVLDKMFHFCWREKDTAEPRFVFIDPIDKIHPHLVSSLLKILEEPPKNVYFFLFSGLSTSMSEPVLRPLLSRVIHLRFSRLSRQEIMSVAQKKWFFFDEKQQQRQQALQSSLALYGEKLDFSLFFQWSSTMNAGFFGGGAGGGVSGKSAGVSGGVGGSAGSASTGVSGGGVGNVSGTGGSMSGVGNTSSNISSSKDVSNPVSGGISGNVSNPQATSGGGGSVASGDTSGETSGESAGDISGVGFGEAKKIFAEHEKLKQRGGFKKDLQIGLLLSDFAATKDSLPTISLRRLFDETKYAIHLFLESRLMGKKLNFSLPFYMYQKKLADCSIFLHEMAQLEFFLEKNTLREESIFFRWLLLVQQR